MSNGVAVRRVPLGIATHILNGVARRFHILLCSLLKPIKRLGLIRIASLAFGKHDGEIVLGKCMTALSGCLVPSYGLRKISRYALAGAIHHGELELRTCVIILRGLLGPH